jgi:hypothetical protein
LQQSQVEVKKAFRQNGLYARFAETLTMHEVLLQNAIFV